MITNTKTFGKFLDQPILISKLNKAMPAIMLGGTTAIYGKMAHDTYTKSSDKSEAKKEILKKGIVLYGSALSALFAPKIAQKLTKRQLIDDFEKIKEKNTAIISEYIKTDEPTEDITKILNKAKEKILSPFEIKKISTRDKYILDKLIPDPENIKAKDIFSEIKYLSIYGAIPCVGGIASGIIADTVDSKNSKNSISDKLNEGLYQYLANIFMCNIGAGVALGIMEKLKITSKLSRAVGIVAGIILTGVLGGSKIANFVSNEIINPICNKTEKRERTPEAIDMCLHTDDIATVSLLSGLKWIEPALPILYSVSGYKAGIGYKNDCN